jgi:hypothetical protein
VGIGVSIFLIALSMIFWSSWGGPGGLRRRTYVEDEPAPGPRY